PGVDHDDAHVGTRRLGGFQPAKQHRVGVGHVGTGDEDGVGKLEVFIAGGRRVGAQGLLVADHGARHAQARVGVDIVGTNEAAGDFVEDGVVFGEQLAGEIKAHRVRAVLVDDVG